MEIYISQSHILEKGCRKMDKNKIALILGLVCLILTIAICVQVKTVEDSEKVVGKTSSSNDGLRDEVLQLREKYNNTYKELEKAELELEQVRIQAVSNNEGDLKKEEEIKQINKLLGYTEVSGPGFIIYLDDNRNVSSENVLDISTYLVHAPDLLEIVNELFNAGADAISINDQRIVSTTEIMCDGNIIRINGELIGVPITIKAIGFPERLYGALNRPKGYLDIMREEGVLVGTEKVENITIPKYEGVYTSDFIN